MKKNIKTMVSEAETCRKNIEEFISKNTFSNGKLHLKMVFNPNNNHSCSSPFTYYLTNGNTTMYNLTFEELNELKSFLNNVRLLET